MLAIRLATVLAGLSSLCVAASVTFTNTRRLLFDTDGNQVDAYGSKINYFNGSYWLYGNAFSTNGGTFNVGTVASFATSFGIKSYRSIDLINWEYQGYIYDPTVPNPCSQTGGCGRPHIIYNQASNRYILWANAGSDGYIIATSSSPAGPFTFENTTAQIDPVFNGLQPADFAVETFGDEAYIVFSALNFRDPRAGSLWPPIFQTLHISSLTSDYMNTTLERYNVTSSDFDLIDQETESPDIFKRDGIYYITASNTCGYCNGSIGLVYRSDSIKGPWTRQIISGFSCSGQHEGVLPLSSSYAVAWNRSYDTLDDTTYVWSSTSVPGGPRVGWSGHIFQPLDFERDGSVKDLQCGARKEFHVNFTAGIAPAPTGTALGFVDGSPALADYTTVCDSDLFTFFQTWTVSKTGTLTQVAVNIARSVQTVPLTITVFRFSNLTDLYSPEYRYETLGSATFNASQLSFTFDTAKVSLNATVTTGDNLGLSFAGEDFAPYCHLETAQSESHHVLLQQGQGQNSWRGLKGHISPVYVREGKEIKWFATVV